MNNPFADVQPHLAGEYVRRYQSQLTGSLPKDYMYDPDSSTTLNAPFADTLGDYIDDLNSNLGPSWSVKVRQGVRPFEEQAGHVHSGASTTPLSQHFFGMAADLVFLRNGQPVQFPKNPELAPYEVKKALKTVESTADKYGLMWGGKWKDPYDPWHVQQYPNSVEMLKNQSELVPLYQAHLPKFQEMAQQPRYQYHKELIDYLLSLQQPQQ